MNAKYVSCRYLEIPLYIVANRALDKANLGSENLGIFLFLYKTYVMYHWNHLSQGDSNDT